VGDAFGRHLKLLSLNRFRHSAFRLGRGRCARYFPQPEPSASKNLSQGAYFFTLSPNSSDLRIAAGAARRGGKGGLPIAPVNQSKKGYDREQDQDGDHRTSGGDEGYPQAPVHFFAFSGLNDRRNLRARALTAKTER
jgi:hypothetical protein